ncbi:MAG: N-formylglutamate deformylase [Pseudomonadota bacterium]
MKPVIVARGEGPVILAQPHSGTGMPDNIAARLNTRGRELIDTDWHIDRLYDGLLETATVVRARFHRYVIDANRDPSGESLYPGQNTTGLIPRVTFRNEPIWRDPPDAEDVNKRRLSYHSAYHDALQKEVDRIRAGWGLAVVYDCHSITSRLPFLFEGRLPVLNVGDNSGSTCSAALTAAVMQVCENSHYSHVLNGRFRGGWTTRHYGRPDQRVHAIQMEIAQSAYLKEEATPFDYCTQKAEKLRRTLKTILRRIEEWAHATASKEQRCER